MITPTIQELQLYIPTATSFEMKLPPFQKRIDKAERDCLKKWFSMPVANWLFLQQETVDIVKNCIYNYAFFEYLPYANVRASNAGLQQVKTTNEMPARPEDVESLRNTCYQAAMDEIESLFEYLEEKAPFVWTDSPYYTLYSQFLIKNVTEFNKYCNIANSRRVFLSLKSSIEYAENMVISPVFSSELLTSLRQNNLSDKKKTLLEAYIKPAVAHTAFADGMPEMSVIFGKYDTVLQFDNTTANGQKGYKSADSKAIDRLIEAQKAKSEKYIEDGLAYIRSNATSFPEFPAASTSPNTLTTVKSNTAVWF